MGPAEVGLQLLDLLDQQGDVLQQVLVLQQQLVDAGLGLQPGRGLRTQLVLQQVHLDEQEQEEEEEEEAEEEEDEEEDEQVKEVEEDEEEEEQVKEVEEDEEEGE